MDIARIISDHTRSGLNAAIGDMPFTMDGPQQILQDMRPDAKLGVMDVEDAFPSLPINQKYYPYLYVVWYNTDPDATSDDSLYLYRTVCGDFGVRSLPYLWDT